MEKSREEKIDIIRNAVNTDEWMERMTDEDLDEVLTAISLPAKRIIKKIWDIASSIVKSERTPFDN